MLPESDEISLRGEVLEQAPFPHFGISGLFAPEKAAALLNWLEATDLWSFTKTSFYTQYEFSLIRLNLPDSLKFLNTPWTLAQLEERFSNIFEKNLKVIAITVHKLVDGYKMGVHNDFIGSEETHRLVIQVNDNWTDDNGGYLMLFNSDKPTDVARVVRPVHNSGIGFEISERSYHAVSAVHHFTRYTLVYTFNAAE